MTGLQLHLHIHTRFSINPEPGHLNHKPPVHMGWCYIRPIQGGAR
jgi:hypothetical protein